MPDGQSDGTRNFVVVYDTQPQGTGYLHRLADPEEFRAVLELARDAIAGLRLRHEDARLPPLPAAVRPQRRVPADEPGRGAGHADTGSSTAGTFRRATRTDEISLIHQVESELEMQFLHQAAGPAAQQPGSGLRIEQGDRPRRRPHR